jgi:hypothetical protein
MTDTEAVKFGDAAKTAKFLTNCQPHPKMGLPLGF